MKPTTEDRKQTIIDEMNLLNEELNKLNSQGRVIDQNRSRNRIRFEQLRGKLEYVEETLKMDKEAKKTEKKDSKKE